MGSILSSLGSPGLASYATAKAALVGLTRTAALELAPKHVRVNAILAGYVETPMTRALGQMLGQEHLTKMAARHPLGLGRPEDVANAATFLLADASRWVTGACISVDGGYSAE
jgi:NAD(P)-dependent dehydrogenase (short-subunit alcohol dehydrogenase family)